MKDNLQAGAATQIFELLKIMKDWFLEIGFLKEDGDVLSSPAMLARLAEPGFVQSSEMWHMHIRLYSSTLTQIAKEKVVKSTRADRWSVSRKQRNKQERVNVTSDRPKIKPES